MVQVIQIEIPASDIQRAVAFYREALGVHTRIEDAAGGRRATLFDITGLGAVRASLVEGAAARSREDKPLVYIFAGPDLNSTLERVEAAGGRVLVPKTPMGSAGYYATFADTEGNVLALHSVK